MNAEKNKKTAIVNATVFDGNNVIGLKTVVFENGIVIKIGGEVPADAEIVDGSGATLIPGLIDAHVHTSIDGLREALQFGVTTELEMAGSFGKKGREMQIKDNQDLADVRSACMGLTPPGGHPDELMPKQEGIPDFILKKMEKMNEQEKADFIALFEAKEDGEKVDLDVTTIEGAIRFVKAQIENGADYFKVMIEEGTVLNAPGLPMLSQEVIKAAVDEAHKLNKIAIAHVLTADTSKAAIEAGMDGLAHLFIDRPEWTKDLVQMIAKSGAFVTPCLVLNSSILGKTACHVANDKRVTSKLSADWKNTMCSCFNTFPVGKMEDSFKNVLDLHNAGVDILVGTDVSYPIAHLGGLAHGVSVHHELQLLVEAGLSPIEALQAATSVPAKRFDLNDRGFIIEGNRADFVLVKGDPTINISDTLSIIGVWKEGVQYLNN
ncbi:MAG: amidohydrolase family protein [Bacteroidota bacterium]|nr:amidohydrolase family protein [Bacteroidota bacterium]